MNIKQYLNPIESLFRLYKYYPRYRKAIASLGFKLRVKDTNETLEYIIQNRCSISRYGDGEFRIMKGLGNGFCTPNPFIQNKLIEVWKNEIPNHIIGIPYSFSNTQNLRLKYKVFWISFFCKIAEWFKENTDPNRQFYSAEFTRFYLSYKDKSVCKEFLKNNRRLWDSKDILFVEGRYSRLGVGNDLFDNAASIQRILCPEKDAYLKYEEIMEMTRQHAKGKLVLLALGQTATGLAYDLAKEGIWAVDIGHIDIEYEWFLRNATQKVVITGKHVNEVKKYIPTNDVVEDHRYEQQIIGIIE